MMFSRLSIRSRITIGSIVVAGILLSIALVIVRAQVATTLTDADAALAQSDLTSFRVDIQMHGAEKVDDPGTGVLVYVRDPSGTVQLNTLPRDVQDIVNSQAARDSQTVIIDDEGRSYIVVGRAVSTTKGQWALWSARSTSSSQLALEGFDRVLVIGGLALLAGFAVASWLLTSVALRPVTAMRRKAEALGLEGSEATLPVGAAHDELSALATTLNAFLARQRAATEREKHMVSDAAHELRTPLAALRTQLELAHADFGDAAALAVQLTTAESSVKRLSSLATNLLELSRLEAHESSGFARAAALVDEFLGSIDRGRMVGLVKRADISFDVQVGAEDDAYSVDPQAFGRLIDNLMSNAVNAIGEGGTITAHLRQCPTSLDLTVADDGPGMPEKFLPMAFDRFSRPDESRSTRTGGSGLGLALVQAVATAAGGTAELQNTNPGLLVSVSIPRSLALGVNP